MSKAKFREASNCRKRVLRAVKPVYDNKIKSIFSHKLLFRDYWRITISVFNTRKSAIPPLFNGSEVLFSASNKAKLFAEIFSINSNLDYSGWEET